MRSRIIIAVTIASGLLLSGCASTSSPTTTSPSASSGSTAPSASTSGSSSGSVPTSAPSESGSGAKCTDLTAAAASAAVGKSTTVKATPITPLAGLTICDVTVADEVYPIQLAVNTTNAAALFTADQQVSSGVDLSGVGDKAFSSTIGIEALSGNVEIKVTGPAGPVLNKNYTIPTAIAKAMVAALK